MSEPTARPAGPPRGRGTSRGGGRGGRPGRRPNGDKAATAGRKEEPPTISPPQEDEGNLGELRKKYGDKISVVYQVFSDWSDMDILFALQGTDGDEVRAIELIASGSMEKFGEVKKTPRSKTKDSPAVLHAAQDPSHPSGWPRGGRNVSEGGRGGGRNFERGGGGRGRSRPPNGSRPKETIHPRFTAPVEDSSSWNGDKSTTDGWDVPALGDDWTTTASSAKEAVPNVALAATSGSIDSATATPTLSDSAPASVGPPKTWASMLRQSTAPKPVSKARESSPKFVDVVPEPLSVAELNPPLSGESTSEVSEPTVEIENKEPLTIVDHEVALPPAKDQLTESNLGRVLDESSPAADGTAASTAADSWEPHILPISNAGTPVSASQHQHQPIRPVGGFATTALKATAERTVRTPGFQRRVLDQQEAVRMPGNRELDRTAVQFGAFSLNGAEDDIDGDREEPETRAQPPADSPVAAPRTSLPPTMAVSVPETVLSQKLASSVPAAGPPPGVLSPPIAPSGLLKTNSLPAGPVALTPHQQVPTPAAEVMPPANQQQPYQYNRFPPSAQSVPVGPQETVMNPKPFEGYSQPNAASSGPPQYENYQHSHLPPAHQPTAAAAVSSAPTDYSSYYAADQNRQPYSGYGQYGQQQQGHQNAPVHHESVSGHVRGFAGYNGSNSEMMNQYPQMAVPHNQSRFAGVQTETQNSGHSTPNPPGQAQHQAAHGFQPQAHGQQTYHPYMGNPYYHQFFYSAAPYPKGNMYSQPYAASPQGHYDHTSAGFSQSAVHRADGAVSSGLGDYGRTASGQTPAAQPGYAGMGYTSAQDAFQRASPFQSPPNQSYAVAQPPAGVPGAGDELKPFADAAKPSAGPSPSIVGARPNPSTNTAPTAAAGPAGLPPPQAVGTAQMGAAFGVYPGQLQGLHGNNSYGGSGAQHTASQQAAAPYASYGTSAYYASGGQQRGAGWGSNYH